MNQRKIVDIDKLDALVFDFDGVLTDNKVHISEDGKELVSCSRADGLGFDVLRKLKKPVYIVSTEKNLVVEERARKLKIPVLQGVDDKVKALKSISYKNKFSLEKILYIGNDLNDYKAIQLCGYSACPSDSHKKIKSISNIILKGKGGSGLVRELLEDIFKLDFIKILF
jgi:YrbI family 3-deoxy-D-manno-octulosonate 8-phosphate phosphatase